MKVLVIADDFTGALDTGVMFSLSGANTLVKRIPTDALTSIPNHIDVVVVNTDSRHLSEEESYKVVKNIINKGIKKGFKTIYKKIDSALRGNVVSESQAVSDAVEQSSIAFVPGYPEIDRVLKNGILYVEGIPINESVFGSDPYSPVTEGDVTKLFKKNSDLTVQLIKNSTDNNFKENTDVLIFDSHTVIDMQKIGKELKKKNLLNVTIGCASFAKIVSTELFGDQKDIKSVYKKNKIIISGSVNPITKKQIMFAENNGFTRIALTPIQLLMHGYWETDEGRKDIEEFLTLISNENSLIFETFSNLTNNNIKLALQTYNIERTDIRQTIADSLGELTRKLFNNENNHTYMFIGGDTLNQVMEIIEVDELYPIKELESGIVLSKLFYNNSDYHIISKSGGFGSEDLLINI